ncbi:MAG: beta-lactamase family protein, partial [Anaerolineales bacterium]|nr:beta-lactamase family protein [Anaerolineales bacterium]
MKRDLQKVIAHVDTFLKQKMAAARTPALTIALLDREQTLYVGTYGYANLETRTPLTPQHLFEIGSVGKVFTAVAILQLHEQGQLDLHAPVTDYLPWFAVNNPFAQPITLHHLLRNTSGLGAGLDFSPDGRGEVWELRQTTLGFAPGSQVHYSNVGYKVLGLVLEAVTQRPYPDIIERQILQPLGMTQSVAQITHDTRARLAVGYMPVHDDRPFHASRPLMPAPWLETNTGDGAIAATAADMARFWRMLLNEGMGENGRILSPESYRLLLQWGQDLEAYDDWAYGLYRFAVEGTERIFHTGDMPGYMASLTADLETGLGVVVLLTQPPAYSTPFYPLSLLQAWRQGERLPRPPAAPDPLRVDNAADYAGEYRCGDKRLTVVAEKKRLFLLHDGARLPLEMQEEDVFYTPHAPFDRFMLEFGREEEALTTLHVHHDDDDHHHDDDDHHHDD